MSVLFLDALRLLGKKKKIHFPVWKCCYHFETAHLFSVTERLRGFHFAPNPPGSWALPLSSSSHPIPSHSSLHHTRLPLVPGTHPLLRPSGPLHLLFLLPQSPFPGASLVPNIFILWSSAGMSDPVGLPQSTFHGTQNFSFVLHYTHL